MIKSSLFVKSFKGKLLPHIEKHYNRVFENLHPEIDLKLFIKACSTNTRKFSWLRNGADKVEYIDWIDFEIDGAQFKIADIPTALCTCYRRASRAL